MIELLSWHWLTHTWLHQKPGLTCSIFSNCFAKMEAAGVFHRRVRPHLCATWRKNFRWHVFRRLSRRRCFLSHRNWEIKVNNGCWKNKHISKAIYSRKLPRTSSGRKRITQLAPRYQTQLLKNVVHWEYHCLCIWHHYTITHYTHTYSILKV